MVKKKKKKKCKNKNSKNSKLVTWCFTPSQPLILYEGERATRRRRRTRR